MKHKFYIFLIPFLFSCALGKKQVFFSEMQIPPIINLTENGIIIKTENSKENSALLIYSIKSEVNKVKNEIYLTGFQAAGKNNPNEFNLRFKKDVIEGITNYKIYWVDPDNKKNELKILNAP